MKVKLRVHLCVFVGSILVFLPGFEDMSMVNKVIIEELIAKDNLKITIYMLHSMMQVIYYNISIY